MKCFYTHEVRVFISSQIISVISRTRLPRVNIHRFNLKTRAAAAVKKPNAFTKPCTIYGGIIWRVFTVPWICMATHWPPLSCEEIGSLLWNIRARQLQLWQSARERARTVRSCTGRDRDVTWRLLCLWRISSFVFWRQLASLGK